MRRKLKPAKAPEVGPEDERGTRFYYWWLLLALVIEYVRPTSFFPSIAIIKLNSLVPFTLLIVVLFAPGLRPFKAIFSDRSARWLVAFVLLILLSVPFAEVSSSASDVFIEVLSHFILFVIIARIAITEQRLCGIFFVLILSHLILIVLNPALVLDPEKRSYINGSPYLGDGNDFALSICLLFPMAIELALRARSRFSQIAAWVAVIALLLAVIGTQSRGGTIALCVIAGYLWLTSERKGAMSLGIGAVVLIAALFASDAYLSRMGTIKNYQMDSSAGARVTAWKSAVWMARDNPVLGVGAGHFPVAYATKYLPSDADTDKMMTAHSMYFLVLGELGLPGLVTFAAVVFGGIRAILAMRRRVLKCAADPPSDQNRRISRMLNLLAASGLGFAVAGAFLSVAYYPHVFVLTAILLSARAIASSVPDVDDPNRITVGSMSATRSGAPSSRRQRPSGRRASRASTQRNGR